MQPFTPATVPTFYFIGVTTGQSSIMGLFPKWAEALGLGDVAIKGIDFPLGTPAADYREAVAFLKADPLSRGALVTTHKLSLFAACRDLFDRIDPLADLMRETSCLSKRGDAFVAHAKDPITAGLAMDGVLGDGHFTRTGGELFCMGAGGSGIAITWHLMRASRGADLPARIVVSDTSRTRLDELHRVHDATPHTMPIDYVQVTGTADNDAILGALKPGSLVVNATGLGKDAPGSPLGHGARFPQDGIVWELNYRGALVFLDQARAQATEQRLTVEDGWIYFLHGWTQVIAEVFDVAIPPSGPLFERLAAIARAPRGA